MIKKYDIVALGECLIDVLTKVNDGVLSMEGNPGGAPANMLSMSAKLGKKLQLFQRLETIALAGLSKKKFKKQA